MKLKQRLHYLLLLFFPIVLNAQSNQIVGQSQVLKFEKNQVSITSPLKTFQEQLKLDASFDVKQKYEYDEGRVKRYQVTYKGLDLLHKHIITHTSGTALNKIISTGVDNLSIESELDNLGEERALALLVAALDHKKPMLKNEGHPPSIRKVFFPKTSDKKTFVLTYEISIHTAEPSRYLAYIDANSGKMLSLKEHNMSCNSPGTAETFFSGLQNITTDYVSSSNDYVLHDCTRGGGIRTQKSLTDYGGPWYIDVRDDDNDWSNFPANALKDKCALDAHWGIEQSFDFYDGNYGFDVTQGAEFNCQISTNYSTRNYAYYEHPNKVVIGERRINNQLVGFISSIDIMGHEVTHGAVAYSAGLIYEEESGALNEAYADMIGTIIQSQSEPLNWEIGEDIFLVRSMKNPKAFEHPNTYQGQFYYTDGDQDLLVHTNSGVINYWFYLLSEGGYGINDNGDSYNVSAIGVDEATGLVMELLLSYLTPSSNFHNFRDFAIALAADTYGPCSPQVISIINAFYAVGLGPAYDGGQSIVNYTADPVTNCSAALSWDEIGAAYYTVYYRILGTSTWEIIDHIPSNNHTLIDLDGGTTYEWYVSNPCQSSSQNGSQQFTTGANCPSIPLATIESVDYCGITLSWENLGAQFYSFNYRVAGSNDPFLEERIMTNSITLSTPDIDNALTYEYYLVVYCSEACSSDASPLQSFNLDYCAPNLTAYISHITSCEVIFEWEAMPGHVYGYSYRFHYTDGTVDNWIPRAPNGPDYTSLPGHFPPNVTQLDFKLEVRCESEDCRLILEGNVVSVTIPAPNPGGVCNPPANAISSLEENQYGNHIWKLDWDAPASYDYFEVRYRYLPGGFWQTREVTSPSFIGYNNSTYSCVEYEIRTVCICDTPGSYSGIITGETCMDCKPPKAILVTDLCPTTVNLEFSLYPSAHHVEWDYRIEGAANWTSGPLLTFNNSEFELVNLNPNTIYEIRARSVCGETPEYSDYTPQHFLTPELCLPVSNFVGVALDENTALISWNPVTSAEYYILEYRAANSTDWYGGNVSGNSIVINFDLTSGAYFRIRASCFACGMSEWSEAIYLFQEYCPEASFATCEDVPFSGAEECTFYYQENPCSNGGFHGYVWLIDDDGNPIENLVIDWNDDGSADTNPYYFSNPWMQNCADVPVSVYNDADCRELYYFNPDCCGSYPPILECGNRNEEGWDIHYNQVCGVSSYIFSVSCVTSNGVFEEYEVLAGASPEGIFTVPVGDLFCDDIVVTVVSRCESGAISPRSNCIMLNHRLGFCTSDDDCEWYEGPRFDGSEGEANGSRNAAQVLLYPNPATAGEFYVQLTPEMSKTGDLVLLDIYDLHGKLIVQHSLDAGHATHKVKANLVAGMYLVAFKNLEGNILDTRRLVMGQAQD